MDGIQIVIAAVALAVALLLLLVAEICAKPEGEDLENEPKDG